jgi:hypothetical protein
MKKSKMSVILKTFKTAAVGCDGKKSRIKNFTLYGFNFVFLGFSFQRWE